MVGSVADITRRHFYGRYEQCCSRLGSVALARGLQGGARDACSYRRQVDRVVVGALAKGPIRYNEIRRRVEGISQRMLTLTLKGLEQDGLVTRTMYPTIPPRVDY